MSELLQSSQLQACVICHLSYSDASLTDCCVIVSVNSRQLLHACQTAYSLGLVCLRRPVHRMFTVSIINVAPQSTNRCDKSELNYGRPIRIIILTTFVYRFRKMLH